MRFAAEATTPGCARIDLRRHGAERSGGRHADAARELIGTRTAVADGETRPIRKVFATPDMIRRPLIALLIAGRRAALAPTAASAEVIEVGAVPPASPPSCPTRPCLAVSRHDRLPGQGRHDART